MPVTDAAKKAVRRDENRTVYNDRRRKKMREAIKEVKSLVKEEDYAAAEEALPAAYKAIDKAAKDNIIHQNKAGRKKSKLAKLVDQES